MALPKLEGCITVPTGGWSVSVSEDSGGVGPVSITVSAGDYYLTSTTSLLTALATAMTANGTLAGTYAATLDDTSDSATGRVTLTLSSGATNFSLTWTSTDLRDVLGFSGNISNATSSTGAYQARYLFLPNCGRSGAQAPEPSSTSRKLGSRERDFSFSLSPSGYSASMSWNTRWVDTLNFQHLKGNKTWVELESTTNESLEKFYEDVIGAGKKFRYHKTRDDDTLYWTEVVENAGEFKPPPLNAGWYGANSIWSASYIMRRVPG